MIIGKKHVPEHVLLGFKNVTTGGLFEALK
jgi:hypothetical protein